MTLLNTGMTRDGLFLIENGEIVERVQNFRWNEVAGGSASTTSRRSDRRFRCTRVRPTTTPNRVGPGDAAQSYDDLDFTGSLSTETRRAFSNQCHRRRANASDLVAI